MRLSLNSTPGGYSWTKKDYLLAAAKRLGIDWVVDGADEGEEYVLNIEPYEFVRGTKWTGIWEIDLLLDREDYKNGNWSKADDLFFATSSTRETGNAHLLFQACDPVKHRRFETKEHYDFVLCGTNGDGNWAERTRLIDKLKGAGYSFYDYGKGHSIEVYPAMYSTGKVQFIRSMKTALGDGELAQRFFECLAIGPVLTNWVDDLKYTGLIEDVDYMAYRDDVELLDKMKKLIDNEELRNKIAASGRRKAVMFHSYENRLISIINAIKEHDDSR